MRILRIFAAGAVVASGAVGGTIAAVAASSTSASVGDTVPLEAAFTDISISAATRDTSTVVDLSEGIEVTMTWEADGTLCVIADTGDGGPGACFSEDQIAAGIAYMRYQEKETTDGLLIGVVPDPQCTVQV